MSWPQDFQTNFQFLLRWLHFLGGITWIGMLYFFNLVNVNFQKEIDAPTKLKVNPFLLTRTLFWFRWGAVLTWFTGFIYYFLIANTEKPGHKVLAIFLVGWAVAFVIVSVLLRMAVAGGPLKDGRVLGVVIFLVMAVVSWLLAYYGRQWGARHHAALSFQARWLHDRHIRRAGHVHPAGGARERRLRSFQVRLDRLHG